MDGESQCKYGIDVAYPNSTEGLKKVYTKWASSYDQDMTARDDVSNETMVAASIGLIENKESTQMLDVGAGTGRTAEYFKRAGFKGQIVGTDMSSEMLEMAAQKGIYRTTFVHTLTPDSDLPMADQTYDVVTAAACLVSNHLQPECILWVTMTTGGLRISHYRLSFLGHRWSLHVVILMGFSSESVGRMIGALGTDGYRNTSTEKPGVIKSVLDMYTIVGEMATTLSKFKKTWFESRPRHAKGHDIGLSMARSVIVIVFVWKGGIRVEDRKNNLDLLHFYTFQPMVKVLKTGGVLIYNSRISEENKGYLERIIRFGDDLEKDGKVKLLKREELPYVKDGLTALVVVYKKL